MTYRWAGIIVLAGALAACSGPDATPQTPGFETAADASWSVNDCSIIGPGATAEAPSGGAGTAEVLVTGAAEEAPTIAIREDAVPASELQIVDIESGLGAGVAPGDLLEVQYCGVGLESRAVFDSSWARGEPAVFPLDGLITGWQEGLPGMQEGGRRLLVIPGALAYGATPPPGIAPDETLVFVIDLIGRQ
jgi:peptidylprolyl isomerase